MILICVEINWPGSSFEMAALGCTVGYFSNNIKKSACL